MLNRNLLVLFCAQCLALSAAPAIVLTSGLVGVELAPDPAWATLPMAASIVGTAMGAVPAALLMRRFGRRAGFSGGIMLGAVAAVAAAGSLLVASFWLFTVAVFGVGVAISFIQQFRFAAAESVPVDQAGRAISFLMLSGIVTAWLGPEVARRGAYVAGLPTYTGSFLAIALLMFVGSLVLLGFRDTTIAEPNRGGNSQPLTRLISPSLLLAIVGAITAYAVMSMVMTATPLELHHGQGHSLDEITLVIQSHIMAMFLPSLFSGRLIARIGARAVMALGVFAFMGSVGIALSGISYEHFWGALVVLGIAWNFLFVGSTTLLAQESPPDSRFRIQAVNEVSVFTAQALAALGAGWVVRELGWYALQWLAVPLLLLTAGLLLRARTGTRRLLAGEQT